MSTEMVVEPETIPSGSKRSAPADDAGKEPRKRICGPGEDVTDKLEEMMAAVGDNGRNVVKDLEEVQEALVEHMEMNVKLIINVFIRCIKFKPEKLTIYSTLAGIVNAKNAEFGKTLIDEIILELNKCLEQGEFDISLRIITFVADLTNSKLVSLESAAAFLSRFVESLTVENLQNDFFVYAVLHTLPWIGRTFFEASPDALNPLLKTIEEYIQLRKKNYLKVLQVWAADDQNLQQADYLDSLWSQILRLQRDDWNEQHIMRVYMAFKNALADSQAHELSEVVLPVYSDAVNYPLPRIVFRLFTDADCVNAEAPMPEVNTIDRFLVEEDLNWIISNNYLNWRTCCRELLAYYRADAIPLAHCIVEVIFSQMFRLPDAPYLDLFYGALLIELCRKSSDKIPQVLAYATQKLYGLTPHMQIVCLERFVNWFSYHLSNFQFRWSWEDWSDSLKEHVLSPKHIFVREVLERCVRLCYHSKICELLPKSFEPIIPEEPVFRFVVDDPSHPAHEDSQDFSHKICNRATPEEILLAVKRHDVDLKPDECIYDPDLVAIFTGTLLKEASQTFSHTFAALNRYQPAFVEFVKWPVVMQPVLLRTVQECWGQHRQFVVLIVDKLLKMQVMDPQVIIAWVFSGDLKQEIGRSWPWELLNLSITRASKQNAINLANKEAIERVYMKKKARMESQKSKAGGDDGNDLLPVGDDMDDEEGEGESEQNVDDRFAALVEDRSKAVLALEKSSDELRNIVLDVCHKFTLSITEHLFEREREEIQGENEYYHFLVGRFKETLLLHWRDIFAYWDDLQSELLNTDAVDDRIREIFMQFRALKF